MRIARVYEEVGDREGTSVLVDRLWPRGMRRDDPRAGRWRPDVAPSTELRRWYGHDPERYAEFVRRYERELATEPTRSALGDLAALVEQGPVTLVTATRDVEHSHLPVLADVLGSGDIARLLRWEHAGGHATVAPIADAGHRVTLLRCDGGEEVDRFESTDPHLVAFAPDPS